MSEPRRRERIDRPHRLRANRDFQRVKLGGKAFRGHCCLVLALATPDEPTRVGIITSRRAVGGAVQRNRARRRLREIVRRRWLRIPEQGWAMVLIAQRAVLDAPHQDVADEVETLLGAAGILAPPALGEGS
jgi:ribonuclease P protein component